MAHQCDRCRLEFSAKKSLNRHKRRGKCLKCRNCQQNDFTNLEEFQNHRDECIKQCPNCKKTVKDVAQHKRQSRCVDTRTFQCNHCAKKFKSGHGLKWHSFREHSGGKKSTCCSLRKSGTSKVEEVYEKAENGEIEKEQVGIEVSKCGVVAAGETLASIRKEIAEGLKPAVASSVESMQQFLNSQTARIEDWLLRAATAYDVLLQELNSVKNDKEAVEKELIECKKAAESYRKKCEKAQHQLKMKRAQAKKKYYILHSDSKKLEEEVVKLRLEKQNLVRGIEQTANMGASTVGFLGTAVVTGHVEEFEVAHMGADEAVGERNVRAIKAEPEIANPMDMIDPFVGGVPRPMSRAAMGKYYSNLELAWVKEAVRNESLACCQKEMDMMMEQNHVAAKDKAMLVERNRELEMVAQQLIAKGKNKGIQERMMKRLNGEGLGIATSSNQPPE